MYEIEISGFKYQIKTNIDLAGIEGDVFQVLASSHEKWLGVDTPIMVIDKNVHLTLVVANTGNSIEISYIESNENTFIL